MVFDFKKYPAIGRKVWKADIDIGVMYIMRYPKEKWFWVWDRSSGYTKLEGTGSNYDDCLTQLKSSYQDLIKKQ